MQATLRENFTSVSVKDPLVRWSFGIIRACKYAKNDVNSSSSLSLRWSTGILLRFSSTQTKPCSQITMDFRTYWATRRLVGHEKFPHLLCDVLLILFFLGVLKCSALSLLYFLESRLIPFQSAFRASPRLPRYSPLQHLLSEAFSCVLE